jgi:iron complex outermembrane receptor protein
MRFFRRVAHPAFVDFHLLSPMPRADALGVCSCVFLIQRIAMKKLSFAFASLGALSTAGLWAQTAATPTPTAPSPTLATVIVTANPLGATDLIVPSAQYAGSELLLRAKSTLGETLDGTPGVSSTYFGPNASRPIIRGLDGDRIRVLNNGGAMVDASGLSYDHAVAADPMSLERIEVLRGPGALQYGGNAVGGVINVIDNRIPREPLFGATGGSAGKADVGLATGNQERGGGVLLETGTDRFALHVDAFQRSTTDVSVPVSLACTKPGAAALANKICNSASDTQGGSVGASAFFDHGYLGAAISGYRSDYGTVAEDEVTIGMQANRYALEGELRNLSALVQGVKWQLGRSEYQHTEFEGASPGTVFKNRGNDLRLEARQAKRGAWDGVVGLQTENTRFSADGDEAFAPYSHTVQTALFTYQEMATSWGKISAGARFESVNVESFGNPLVARFTPASRSFTPQSYAVGALWKVAGDWQLSSNVAYTQRAPKDYELFANGPHLATNAYEVGNVNLAQEVSTNVDVGASWKRGANRFGISVFTNQFANYLSQEASGINRDTEGNGGNGGNGVSVTDSGNGDNTSAESGGAANILPEYQYTQVQARFTGLEASGTVRLVEAGQLLDLELRGDMVRAVNTTTGQALPRIVPARLGATLIWTQGAWSSRLGASHAMAQNDVPAGQLETGSYTLWNAALTYRSKIGTSNALWFARIDNLTDTLAYSASSILSQTSPGKAPLPGRTLKVGLQASF